MYRIYRIASPLLKRIFINLGFSAGSCRYRPTCSIYADQAIKRHGYLRGSFLAAKRVIKCHPLSKGGQDPVPK